MPRLALAALVSSAAVGSADAPTYRSVAHVGYLEAGALRVRTLGCERLAAEGWCHVVPRGPRGWVQDRFLEADKVTCG